MKLHRNARLSVKGRELLVERFENAGWSLTQAAEAAGVVTDRAQVAGPPPGPKGSPGCWIAPPRREQWPTGPMSGASR